MGNDIQRLVVWPERNSKYQPIKLHNGEEKNKFHKPYDALIGYTASWVLALILLNFSISCNSFWQSINT